MRKRQLQAHESNAERPSVLNPVALAQLENKASQPSFTKKVNPMLEKNHRHFLYEKCDSVSTIQDLKPWPKPKISSH